VVSVLCVAAMASPLASKYVVRPPKGPGSETTRKTPGQLLIDGSNPRITERHDCRTRSATAVYVGQGPPHRSASVVVHAPDTTGGVERDVGDAMGCGAWAAGGLLQAAQVTTAMAISKLRIAMDRWLIGPARPRSR
jgi:hypothetical protein